MEAPLYEPGFEDRRIVLPNVAPDAFVNVRTRRGQGPARAPIVMVHGASYPAHCTFDLSLDGQSWMTHLAARGHDVHAVDLRNYGLSWRSPTMEAPPECGRPQTTTSEAVADLRVVLQALALERPPILLGWSWGTTICAATVAAGVRAAGLVLIGAQWMRKTPPVSAEGQSGRLPAYRYVSAADALERKMRAVPEQARAALAPPEWLARWQAAFLASDPKSGTRSPPAIRAPNGIVADSLNYWCQGRAPYDPGKITCPVLLAVGEWDIETPIAMSQGLRSALSHAEHVETHVLAGLTHGPMVEARRSVLFDVVDNFVARF